MGLSCHDRRPQPLTDLCFIQALSDDDQDLLAVFNGRNRNSVSGSVAFPPASVRLPEKSLDPEYFTAVRAFAPPPPANAVISPTLKQQEGALATFALRIIFRQNSSWQGSITWLEAGREQSFRSVLELIFLMDSALSGQESASKSS